MCVFSYNRFWFWGFSFSLYIYIYTLPRLGLFSSPFECMNFCLTCLDYVLAEHISCDVSVRPTFLRSVIIFIMPLVNIFFSFLITCKYISECFIVEQYAKQSMHGLKQHLVKFPTYTTIQNWDHHNIQKSFLQHCSTFLLYFLNFLISSWCHKIGIQITACRVGSWMAMSITDLEINKVVACCTPIARLLCKWQKAHSMQNIEPSSFLLWENRTNH